MLGIICILAIEFVGADMVPKWMFVNQGVRTTAVITGSYPVHHPPEVLTTRHLGYPTPDTFEYSLASLSGKPIPGRLNTDSSVPDRVGSRVDVVVDPAGQLSPVLASDRVRPAVVSTIVTVVAWLALTVSLIVLIDPMEDRP